MSSGELPRTEKLSRLSARAHEAADWIVERNVEIVTHSLRTSPPTGPPCSICLMPTHHSSHEALEQRLGREIEPLNVEAVAIDTHADRRQRNHLGDVVVDAWMGIEWDDVRYPNLRSPGFLDREDTITAEADTLIGDIPSGDDEIAEIDWHHWPWGWIFERVAQRLSEAPPVSVTADFVAYYQDSEFEPWPPTLIRHLGRPSAVTLLEEQGLLPFA